MVEAPVSTPSTLRQTTSHVFQSAFPTPRRARTDPNDGDISSYSTAALMANFRAASTPPERLTDGQHKNSQTEPVPSTIISSDQNWLRKTLARKRSQYYDEAFACREPNYTTKSRAAKDSLVTVDIKLNYCLTSEQEFLIDVAFLFSEIYQRPAGCIMVLISNDFSIMLDNSSEPAYQMSITALESEVAVTKNRRTAALIQKFMLESASIPVTRGVLFFHIISAGNMVVTGSTVITGAGQGTEKTADEYADLYSTNANKGSRSRKSSLARPTTCAKDVTSTLRAKAPSFLGPDRPVSIETESSPCKMEKKMVKKRRSLMALLGF